VVFDDSWGTEAGEEWRLVVWGNRREFCDRFEIGEVAPDDEHGISCTAFDSGSRVPGEEILHYTYIPGGQPNGYEQAIAYGSLSAKVRAVEFRIRGARPIGIDALRPPRKSGLRNNFYIAFLPANPCGNFLALNAAGKVIDENAIDPHNC
jgi:hypothetical protein